MEAYVAIRSWTAKFSFMRFGASTTLPFNIDPLPRNPLRASAYRAIERKSS